MSVDDELVNFSVTADKDFFNLIGERESVILFWSKNCNHCENVLGFMDKNLVEKTFIFTVSLNLYEEIKDKTLNFPVYVDESLSVFDAYGGEKIPYMLIADANKIIKKVAIGEKDCKETLIEYFNLTID